MSGMRSRELFFLAALAFIAGTILGGLGFSVLAALLSFCIACAAFLVFRVPLVLMLVLAAFFSAGTLYYAFDDYAYQEKLRSVEHVTYVEGRVIGLPRRGIDVQTATIEVNEADVPDAAGSRIYIRTELLPELSYGDVLRGSGTVVPPPADSYGNYMAKEGVHGTMFYPEVEILGNDANPFFAALFGFRSELQSTLQRLFKDKHAAFLSGILLGDKDGFSPEFLEKLSISGTMHLMALSGLNMTIIVFVALGVFSIVFWKRKRAIFIATFILVALFVAMTGFQVSAIRAALMAFLVGLAGVTHRLYQPHTAIAFAALLITLWNPKAPVFDIGFQLSFLATISIIYLTPVIQRLSFLGKDSFLAWRDALAITLAAQLGVAPLSMINFGNFSFTALLANIAILAVIPVLTIFGFLVTFISFVYPPLALLLGKPVAFLIDYVIAVVDIFAAVYIPFNPDIGISAALLYYCAMIYVIWRHSPKKHDAA